MRSIITTFMFLGLLFTSTFIQAENLEDIYRAANDNNPMLLGAEAQLKSKQELANIQKGSLLPTIGANVSYGYNDSSSSSNFNTTVEAFGQQVQPDSSSKSKTMDLYGQIAVKQELVNFYSWYSFKGAKKMSEEAQLDFANTQQTLIINTVEQYLNILRAKENLASSKAEEEAIKQRLEQTQQRYNVGLAAITEVHEAQSAYDLSKVGRLSSEGGLEVSYEVLSMLTGKEHREINNISANFPITAVTEDKDAWVKTALEHNIDLLKAKKQVEAAEWSVKAARSNHYPVLSAQASYSDMTQDGKVNNEQYGGMIKFSDKNSKMENDNFAIGLNLAIPIYSGGSTTASSRKAAADYQMSIENLNGIKRNIVQKIRALHIAAATKMQQVAARQQAIKSSNSALEAIQAGYDVGTRNIVDVLNAQKIVYAAQRDYANARYDYILSLFELKQAAGTLSPADIHALNEWTN